MLITQCPHCDTIFEATVELLMHAGGRARCGQCHETFDALINLRDRLPAKAGTTAPRPGFSWTQLSPAASESVRPTLSPPESVARSAEPETPEGSESPIRHAAGKRNDPVFDLSDLPPLDDGDMPFVNTALGGALEAEGFVPHAPDAPTVAQNKPRRLGPTLAWGAGSILLTVALLAQGMLSRDAIAGFPPLKAFAGRVCDLAGCTLPLPREPKSLNLVSRDVQPHPSVQGALLISATMINRAPYPQEWPMLEITLADLNGSLLTMRRFGPDIYLSSGMDRAAGMPPDTPIHVVFETEDPGDNAVAFEFRFR